MQSKEKSANKFRRRLFLSARALEKALDKPPQSGYHNRVIFTCRCGGTGRRKGLKIPRWQHRTGSIPVSGTKNGVGLCRLLFAFALFSAHARTLARFFGRYPPVFLRRYPPVFRGAIPPAFCGAAAGFFGGGGADRAFKAAQKPLAEGVFSFHKTPSGKFEKSSGKL